MTFLADAYAVNIDLPPNVTIYILIFWAISLFLAGYFVWKEDYSEYERSNPEIHVISSLISLYQWLNVERDGFLISDPVIIKFSGDVSIYNPRSRTTRVELKISGVNSNWFTNQDPSDIELTIGDRLHAHRYPVGVIDVEPEGKSDVFLSAALHFEASIDREGNRYLTKLNELTLLVRFDPVGQKGIDIVFEPDLTQIHEQVKKDLSQRIHHDLVKQNHLEPQAFELYERYLKGGS